MSDFRLEVKVKNNRLVTAIEKDFRSVNAFCVAKNLSAIDVGRLCNLKTSPIAGQQNNFYKHVSWKKIAIDIADALGMLPEEIWPEHMQDIVLQKNTSIVDVSADFVSKMVSSDYRRNPLMIATLSQQDNQLAAVIDTLDDREKTVVLEYFGFNGSTKTFKEIGDDLSMSGTRVQQILNTALKKLRHPTRSGLLEDFLFTEEDCTMNFENI